MSFVPLVRAWLWMSALVSLAGWLLSALGQLNRLGYVAFGGVVAVALWVSRRAGIEQRPWSGWNWRKARSRFRRLLPGSVALLALLVLLGGAFYPPCNHDGLAYRTPRVLQWLAEGHWHWIHTPNVRMNNRACGFEWLTAPLLLFTGSDRGLFLINFFSFLLLPGLVFSVFTRLGVRSRVAWHWMWLLPTGYAFVLQAGGIANDAFAAVYSLAAVDFALRAWGTRRPADLWLSSLAAALLTGTKATNLPLLLPWAIAVFPLLPLLLRRPLASLGVGLLAIVVSFVPVAVLNARFCGDWSGAVLEAPGMEMKNPAVGIWGNALLLLLQNVVPPVFPPASWWNQHALLVLPQVVVAPMVGNFQAGFQRLGELAIEDSAGIGFGLSLLILVTVLASWRCWVAERRAAAKGSVVPEHGQAEKLCVPARLRWWLLRAPWMALLAYGAKSGTFAPARLLSPYYPLLLPLLLTGLGPARLVRCRWWRRTAGVTVLLAFAVVAVAPGRPLWPAQTVLAKILAWKPGQGSALRALHVYTAYANRSDPLPAVRALLPGDLRVVGFLGNGTDIDISLWRPFGRRRVEHLLLSDSPAYIRQRHIEYAVVGEGYLSSCGVPLANWLKQSGAQLIATTTATMAVSEGPQAWHIVRFEH